MFWTIYESKLSLHNRCNRIRKPYHSKPCDMVHVLIFCVYWHRILMYVSAINLHLHTLHPALKLSIITRIYWMNWVWRFITMQSRKLYSPSKFLVKFNTPQKDIKFVICRMISPPLVIDSCSWLAFYIFLRRVGLYRYFSKTLIFWEAWLSMPAEVNKGWTSL